MEAMLQISLYSYLYLKLAKMLYLSYYTLCFLFNKIREQEGKTGFAWSEGWGEVAQAMYTHVSKCKNYKLKTKQNKTKQKTALRFHLAPSGIAIIKKTNRLGVVAHIYNSNYMGGRDRED
jgi:hypothetical protein